MSVSSPGDILVTVKKAYVVLVSRFLLLMSALVILAGGPTSLWADDDVILREAHAWGRFQKGSWRQVRILTENFDETGQPTDSSVTHNTTTLEEVTPERVTLKVEVTVEVAGQRFPAPSQIVKQGYTGDTLGQTVSVKLLEPETLTVDGQTLNCQTRQVEVVGGVNREVSLISFSRDRQPAILRRKTTLTDAAGEKTVQEATSEVTALDMPRLILDEAEPHLSYLVRTVQKSDRSVTTTWSWHAPNVPGEVVDQSTKKVDPQGQTVRRTTLELVGYGVTNDDLGGTRRSRRARRR